MKNPISSIKKLLRKCNNICRSKTGSTLLMVVMTMSIVVIVGSSVLMLSFNTNLGSLLQDTQTRATQTCLSVAESVKTDMTTLIEKSTSLKEVNDSVSYTIDTGSKLSGTSKVTLTVLESYQQSPTRVSIAITTTVGSSTETITFSANLSSNSTYDIINAVSSATAANGGSVNHSFPTVGVDGDVSLYGDYLLALFDTSERSSYNVNVTYTVELRVVPGTVNGNVYCNGSLVLGSKDETLRTTPTNVTGNVYVNGDLIINGGKINGDVYVAGNILFNGGSCNISDDDPGIDGRSVIDGNVYCGGSIYVLTTPLERYLTNTVYYYNSNVSVSDYNNKKYRDEFEDKFELSEDGFPTFPTLDVIKANSGLFSVYNKSISNVSTQSGFGDITVNYVNGTTGKVGTDLGAANRTWSGDYGIEDLGGEQGKYSAFYLRQTGGISYYIIRNWGLTETWAKKKWFSSGYEEEDVDSEDNTYYTFEVVSGRSSTVKDYCDGSEKTLVNQVADKYLATATNASYGKYSEADMKSICCYGYNPLTVKGNIFTQADAYIEANNTLATYNNKAFYVGGNFEYLGIDSYCSSSNNGAVSVGKGSFTDTTLYVKGTAKINSVGSSVLFASGIKTFYAYVIAEQNLKGQEDRWTISNADKTFRNSGYFKVNETIINNFFDYGFNDTMFYYSSTDTYAISEESAITKKDLARMRVKTNAAYAMQKQSVSINKRAFPYEFKAINVDFTNNIKMYSESILSQNVNLPKSKQKENPSKVSDVFKEMGVYGIAIGINNFDYKSGKVYVSGNSGTTVYESTGNKINDCTGVNFTGVAIAQITFGSTLAKALQCDTVVTSKSDFISKLKKVDSGNLATEMATLRSAWANTSYDSDDKYIGVYTYENTSGIVGMSDDKYNYYVMRDIYIDGATDLVFGDNSTSTLGGFKSTEHIHIDTGYDDINVFIRPTGSHKYNKNAVTGYNLFAMQCSVLESQKISGSTPGVAYVYMIPNFYSETNGTAMTSAQLADNLDDMYGAKLKAGATNWYVSPSGNVYRYAGYYNNGAGASGTPSNGETNIALTSNHGVNSGFKMKQNSDGTNPSYLFIIGEGPVNIWVGDKCNTNAIIYTPNKYSTIVFGNEAALGTGEQNPNDTDSTDLIGGCYATGQVIQDWNGVNGAGWYVENKMTTIGSNYQYIEDKLYDGVSTIQVIASETTRKWDFSEYE